ncbi:hypothetical protein HDV04_002675 [Boothiomyces sp. JEL0838]|nr:hypothetical protein HDV04_002675 [Boothiomyces sp. JEL0838]
MNGIGSFGYHLTGEYGWSKIDQWSEFLLAILAIPLAFNELWYKLFFETGKTYLHSTMSFLSTFLVTFGYLFGMVIDSTVEKSIADDCIGLGFAFALIILIVSTRTTHKQFLEQHPQGSLIIKYGKVGVLIVPRDPLVKDYTSTDSAINYFLALVVWIDHSEHEPLLEE